jgi:hypothetical protein
VNKISGKHREEDAQSFRIKQACCASMLGHCAQWSTVLSHWSQESTVIRKTCRAREALESGCGKKLGRLWGELKKAQRVLRSVSWAIFLNNLWGSVSEHMKESKEIFLWSGGKKSLLSSCRKLNSNVVSCNNEESRKPT